MMHGGVFLYEYIKGKYIGINKDYIIIDNNNIGYKIYTSGATMADMPNIGEEVMVYIDQIVREDFIGLYGFSTYDELEMFKLLISTNGVGAKAALSLLSITRVNSLKYAIAKEDEKLIMRAPGIGKKMAARIILELKDKLKKEKMVIENDALDGQGDDIIEADLSNIREAKSALIALGYTEKEAESALSKADKSETIENIIKSSLKILMG